MKIIRAQIKYFTSYSLLNLDSLEIGSIAPFDILIKKNNDYIIIIEAGTVLSEKLYEKLKKQDNLYISKEDEKKQLLSCESLEYYIQYSKNDLSRSLRYLYTTNTTLFTDYINSESDVIDLKCAASIVKSVILLLKHNKNYLKETIPHFTHDYELASHSLHVAIYAINIGYFLRLNDEELLKLGTAGLLHDCGIKKIDKSIIYKLSELDITELDKVQKHSKYSVEIIKKNHISDPYIIDAIAHHHERYDGNGYPDKLNANQISRDASILALCDVFDALTNNRPHRAKYSSFEALKLMMKDPLMTNQFNQEYLKIFLHSLLK